MKLSRLVCVNAWLAAWALTACAPSATDRPYDAALADAVMIDAPDARPIEEMPIDAVASDAAPPIDSPPDAAPDAPPPIDAPPDAAPDAPPPIDAAPDAAPPPDAPSHDAPLPPDAPAIDAALPDAQPADAPSPPDAATGDAAVPLDAPLPPDAPHNDAPLPPDAPHNDAPLPSDAQLPPDAPPDAAGPGGHLRLVAANITSGNRQAYEDFGIRIFGGIAPDIAMIQEFNFASNTTDDLRLFIDRAFGASFDYVRGNASGQIPNGVVSRFPIIDRGEWIDPKVGNRTFVWARIDIPGPIDLFAISVHLLTSSAGDRNIEAGELRQHIQDLAAGYVVLGGDFNTGSRTEAALQTLSSVLVTSGPFPVDQGGDGDTNAARKEPFDWVLVDPVLQALEVPTLIGANQFPHGFVADTRVYNPIADLAPALANDSGAPSMQHMAVVRDFEIPGGPSAPSVRVIAPNGGESWVVGSSQTVRWTASGVTSVSVELTSDGTTFTQLSPSTPAATGQLSVIVPATPSSTARIRVSAVPGGVPGDTSNAPFTISTTPPSIGHVIINEVLVDEPGNNVAAEFVELVNTGSDDASLSGCTISDAVQVRHVFAAGTVLAAGRAIVVFGGASAIPPGLGNAVAASTNALGLSNGGDTVTLACVGMPLDSVVYASGQAPEGVSINRSPDGADLATFVVHTALSMLSSSPGTRASGAAF